MPCHLGVVAVIVGPAAALTGAALDLDIEGGPPLALVCGEMAAQQVGKGLVHGTITEKADMSRKAQALAAIQAVPSPGEGKRGPEGHLGYLLRQAQASVRGAMDRALSDLGVTSPQFAVLTMIVAYPGVSGADLARLTYLTPQTINVIVGNLERDGAIEKSAHATHGRILRLHATTKGQVLLKRCRSRIADIESEISALLGKDEERIVRRWLSATAEKFSAPS